MEEKLKGLITRIEAAELSDKGKAQLYTAIAEGLQSSIWPALLNALPEGELDALLAETDNKKKVERYSQLLAGVVNEESVRVQIDEAMNALVDEIDAALTEEHI